MKARNCCKLRSMNTGSKTAKQVPLPALAKLPYEPSMPMASIKAAVDLAYQRYEQDQLSGSPIKMVAGDC